MRKAIWAIVLLNVWFSALLWGQKPVGVYYVAANAGLNIRISPENNASKLGMGLYGEKVEILDAATDQSMLVDGISGGMAKVKCKGLVGYMFDGYLVRHVMPNKGESPEDYAGRLWTEGSDVLNEEHHKDYGGYASMEYALHFQEMTWSEAFLIARNLFDIPAALQYHGDKGSGNKVVKNPHARSDAWSDELVTEYDAKGMPKSIYYSFRGEGGGTVIGVSRSDDTNFYFKIYEHSIAD